jgi:hypothetical protein
MKRVLLLSCTVFAILASSNAEHIEICAAETPAFDAQLRVLRESTNRDELEQAAVALINSKDTESLEVVFGFLTDREFLNRLDTEKHYQFSRDLRVEKLVAAIGELGSPSADEFLVRLSRMESVTLLVLFVNQKR